MIPPDRQKLRRPARILTVASASLALVALLASSAHGVGLLVALQAPVQAQLGLKTTVLAAQRRSTQVDAFAKVLDPGPLAALEADLRSSQATTAASRAAAKRLRALSRDGGTVAVKDVEAAVAQADTDVAHLSLLRRRLGLEWGPGIARMSEGRRTALLDELAQGRAALVHVDTPSNEGQEGARTVDIDVGSASVHGAVLGAARVAEPRLQSSGLIVKVSGKGAVLLSVGLTQSAHINQSTGTDGVVIPRSAVIRFQGSDWAYLQRGPAAYERRLIEDPVPQENGLFVARGFRAGEWVVSQGAQELFAVEQSQANRAR